MKRERKKRRNKKIRKIAIIALVIILIALVALLAVLVIKDMGKKGTDTTESSVEEQAPEAKYVEYDRVDAPYEHWLAAAVVTGISMDYPDFELEGIYAAGETELEQAGSSEGVYVIFTSNGERKGIRAVHLDGPRTAEAGTKDITSDVIGYASYEEVSPDSMDVSGYQTVEIEDLNTLIGQSERVTVYTN